MVFLRPRRRESHLDLVHIVYGVDYQGIQSCLLPTLSCLRSEQAQQIAFAIGVPVDI